jgi:O-antigen/teichoic acid export membrane protein
MGLLRNALIKFIHDERYLDKRREVQSASIMINILFSLFVILCIAFGSRYIADLLNTPHLESLLYYSIALIIFQIPFNHAEMVQQSNMQYKTTFYAYFLRQGLLFLFIVLSVFVFTDMLTLQNLVTAQIVALLISGTYFIIASRKLLSGKFHFDKEVMGKLLHFGKYVFGTSLLSSISKYADHFVTASAIGNPVLGKVFVSYYSVVARITSLLDFPFMAVADVLFPKNAHAMANEGLPKVKYYFERMVGIITALIVPVSLFIFIIPGPLIRIIAGPDYLPAVPILQVTMFFAFLRPFISHFGFTMDSIGKPQLNFLINTVILTISLLSTYFCIRWFGGRMGAVYATSFTLFTATVMTFFILKSHLNIEISNILRYMINTYSDIYQQVKKFPARFKVV